MEIAKLKLPLYAEQNLGPLRLLPALLATAVLPYSTDAIAEAAFIDEIVVTAQKRSQVVQDIPRGHHRNRE